MNYVIGNWKMHKTLEEVQSFAEEFKNFETQKTQVGIAPQAIHLCTCRELFPINTWIGGQNCSSEASGALTGEVSPKSLKNAGMTFSIVGHSERRHIFHELDEVIADKLKQACAQKLIPILCLGETLEERDAGQTFDVLDRQLKVATQSMDQKTELIIAYEPVWAIGTGRVAEVCDIEKAHLHIREFFNSLGKETTPPILYGGSVKPSNFKDIIALEMVNGALVGGASLKIQDFKELIAISENS